MWPSAHLSQLCDILDSRRKPITKKNRSPGPYPYYGATGVLDYVEDFLFDEQLVLIGEDGAKWGAGDNSAFKIQGKTWVNNHAHVIRPHREMVLDEWLIYYLNAEDLSGFITGMTVPKLNQGKLKEIPVPLPSISEQQRIVAILDQAFADIEKTRANTEQNLKNARELFDSYLNQASANKQPLGKYVSIKTGKLNSNAATEHGAYPFFTCSRDTFSVDSFSFDCEAILLAGNNASGDFNVKHYHGKFDAYQRTYVITINDVGHLSYIYLYYQMLKSLRELKNSSVGAGTKFLKIGIIENLEISIPPLAEQQRILNVLEPLKENIERLEANYSEKLLSLDELKKSLLQKAFSGELTKSEGMVA